MTVTKLQQRGFMKDLVLALGARICCISFSHLGHNIAATGFPERFGLGPLGSCLLQFLFSSRSQHPGTGFLNRFGLGRWGPVLVALPLCMTVTKLQQRAFMKDLVLALGARICCISFSHLGHNIAATGFYQSFGLGPWGLCVWHFLLSSWSQHCSNGRS